MRIIHVSLCCIIFFCFMQKNNVITQNTVLTYKRSFLLANQKDLIDFRIKFQSKSFYLYENDTLKQMVEISRINEKELNFKLISENKYRNQTSMIEGVAKFKHIEMDEDMEGNGCPILEYLYNEDCWLAFRIDRNTGGWLIVNEADCKNSNPFCPLESVGYLIKNN